MSNNGVPSALSGAQRTEIERWLLRRGLPHFIVGYRATTGIFTRVAWLLTLIVIAELPINSRLDFPGSRIVTPLLAILIAAGIVAVTNLLRGRKLWQRPNSIGSIELAIFILAPALAHLALKGEPERAGALVALNIALLGVIYLATSYAVLPILRSAIVQAAHQVLDVLNVLLKSLPLLLLFGLFAFVNADTWGMASTIRIPLLATALGIVVALGGLFLVARAPHEMRRMASFEDWGQVQRECTDTPAQAVAPRSPAPPDELELDRRERLNVGVLVVASQAVQVTMVTVAIGAFFFAIGLFLITPETLAQWSGLGSEQLREHYVGPSIDVFGSPIQVTRELIIVSSFVAVVSGLQFLIATLTDPVYRAEFADELTHRLRRTLAVRALYRDALN